MLKFLLILSFIPLISSLLTPPVISRSYTAFYTEDSDVNPVEGMIWRDNTRGLDRRFMSGSLPLVSGPIGYSLASTNDTASWTYPNEDGTGQCVYLIENPTLEDFFTFLQHPNLTYEIVGDIERWSQTIGFYNSMTVNTNDRTRPLSYSYGFNRALSTNITIDCFLGYPPDVEVFYLPSTCTGICTECTRVLNEEVMTCSAFVHCVEVMCLVVGILLTLVVSLF